MAYRSRCGKPADAAFRRLTGQGLERECRKHQGLAEARNSRCRRSSRRLKSNGRSFRKGLRRDVDKYLERADHGPQKPQRTPYQAAAVINDPWSPRRTPGRGASGDQDRDPDQKSSTLCDRCSARKWPKKILDAYWQKNGKKPKLYTVDLARRFVAIAKETKCLKRTGVRTTSGNLAPALSGETIRGAYRKKFSLPGNGPHTGSLGPRRQTTLCNDGGSPPAAANAPIRAAVIAQKAVAIAIESVAPVRLAESHVDQARNQPHQAGRASLELLAPLQPGGHQEQRKTGVCIQGLPHPT